MNLFGWTEIQLLSFALVLCRISAFVVAWPVIGTPTVPNMVKIFLILILGVAVYPVVKVDYTLIQSASENLIFVVIREIAVGLTLAFILKLFFFAISIAGEMMSMSLGLASAQIFNPALGIQSNAIEQFKMLLATLFFFAINGHHFLIQGMVESFNVLQAGQLGFNFNAFNSFALVFGKVFQIGIQFAAPVVVALFLSQLALGTLGRAIPQLNVLVTGFPIQLLLGFGLMVICMPLFLNEVNILLSVMSDNFFTAMRTL